MDHEHHDNCSHNDDHLHSISGHSAAPKRSILTLEDLERFQSSPAYEKYFGFIQMMNNAIKNKKLKEKRSVDWAAVNPKGAIHVISYLLRQICDWIEEIPAHEVGLSRFGNPAFRTWLDRLENQGDHLLEPLLLSSDQNVEAKTYLMASFGDYKRIDYGTGHEASFICFLLCLSEWGILQDDDMVI